MSPVEDSSIVNLDVPTIPRENSISSLHLRVGLSSPEEIVFSKEMLETEEDFTNPSNNENPNNYDRYHDLHEIMKEQDIITHSSFNKNTNQTKSPLKEWLVILSEIHSLISQASDAFTYIPNDSILEEVLAASEGSNYIKNIVEIYRVFKRIQVSHQRHVENEDINSTSSTTNEENDRLFETGEKIEQSWKQLTINLNGRSIIPEKAVFNFSTKSLTNNKSETHISSHNELCGLCLLNVSNPNCSSKADNKINSMMVDTSLKHGSRVYHSTCANFWVNQIDLVLPTLSLNS